MPGELVGSTGTAGAVNVIHGSATGLSATETPDQIWDMSAFGVDDQIWDQDSASVEGAVEAGDELGGSVTGVR
jgi:hypothetical protein